MACFFKHQNHSSGGKYPKVLLNITSKSCDFNFISYNLDQDGEVVTAKDFFRAKEKGLNYAYAGGEHLGNYSMSRTRTGNQITFTFELKQVTGTYLDEPFTVMDYANALFKQGSPVFKVVLVFSSAGSLISSSFISLNELELSSPVELECHSTSEDTSDIDLQTPGYRIGNILRRATVNEIKASQSGVFSQLLPVKGTRINTDTVGGTTKITPLAWFTVFRDDHFIFIMVVSSDTAWDIRQPGSVSQYMAWSDEWLDDDVDERDWSISTNGYWKSFE